MCFVVDLVRAVRTEGTSTTTTSVCEWIRPSLSVLCPSRSASASAAVANCVEDRRRRNCGNRSRRHLQGARLLSRRYYRQIKQYLSLLLGPNCLLRAPRECHQLPLPLSLHSLPRVLGECHPRCLDFLLFHPLLSLHHRS